MTVAACLNCGAVTNVRCVDDRCCEREERDAAFLNTVGQSWQSEANRLLDAWAAAQAVVQQHRHDEMAKRREAEQAQQAVEVAKAKFDTFMKNCMTARSQVIAA